MDKCLEDRNQVVEMAMERVEARRAVEDVGVVVYDDTSVVEEFRENTCIHLIAGHSVEVVDGTGDEFLWLISGAGFVKEVYLHQFGAGRGEGIEGAAVGEAMLLWQKCLYVRNFNHQNRTVSLMLSCLAVR